MPSHVRERRWFVLNSFAAGRFPTVLGVTCAPARVHGTRSAPVASKKRDNGTVRVNLGTQRAIAVLIGIMERAYAAA